MPDAACYSDPIARTEFPHTGKGVITISVAHSDDQVPFLVRALTDAVISVKCIDDSTHAGVTINAGTEFPVKLKQVTAITSGTILGIR